MSDHERLEEMEREDPTLTPLLVRAVVEFARQMRAEQEGGQ